MATLQLNGAHAVLTGINKLSTLHMPAAYTTIRNVFYLMSRSASLLALQLNLRKHRKTNRRSRCIATTVPKTVAEPFAPFWQHRSGPRVPPLLQACLPGTEAPSY